MTVTRHLRHASLLVLAAAAFFAISATQTPAAARSQVSLGVGFGFPVYPGVGYIGSSYGYSGYSGYGYRGHHRHHRPHFRSHYRPYYAPPVAYVPRVIYAPPPVVYAPRVIYQQPLVAAPASNVYRSNTGEYCREYQATARIAGQLRNTYGTACQDASGNWRVVN